MSHLPLLNPHDASPEVRSVYDEFYRRMQFPSPPNFITIQGHSGSAARGIWELLKNVLLGGSLPRWKKELIIVAISRERNCKYCVAAHAACCTMLGVSADFLVENVTRISDPVLRDSVLFALKSARDPQALTNADFDLLRRHHISQEEIVELISVSALAVYLNIIADATAVELDEMIKA